MRDKIGIIEAIIRILCISFFGKGRERRRFLEKGLTIWEFGGISL